MMWLILGGLACQPIQAPLDGPFTLRGGEVLGVVEPHPARGCASGGLEIGLWAPSFTTHEPVPAEHSMDEAGRLWLDVPVQTGLGEGRMAFAWSEEEEISLLLGARPGEFELELTVSPGLPSSSSREEAMAEATARLSREQAAWRAGAFLLLDSASREVVGEVHFFGPDHPPMIAVYDALWLTPEAVAARRRDEGGDIVLSFPVEPSLSGESGSLRLNPLSHQATVPSAAEPIPGTDRRLLFRPGTLPPNGRTERMEMAIKVADTQEEEWLRGLIGQLRESGACTEDAIIPEMLRNLLDGYDLSIQSVEKGCEIRVCSSLKQHRRRFCGTLPILTAL